MVVESTAVVKIYPQGDSAVTLLYNEALLLRQYAEARVVKTDDDVKVATNDLAVLSKLKKAIEEKRKEYVGPINEHLKSVNDAFKVFTEPLVQADAITWQKIKAYRAEQERIRAEQERINQLRLEAAAAEMKLKGELTESVDLVEVVLPPAKHYQAETGTLGMIDHWKVEVIDFQLLPDEYKIADQIKLNKVVRAGLHKIAGCRIWNDPDKRVTTK